MPDGVEGAAPEDVGQRKNVRRRDVEPVGFDAKRLVAEIVAALVRRDDVIARFRERAKIVPPAEPEFGKAVQENE